MQNWNAYENLCAKFNTRLGKKIIKKKHRGRRVEKAYNMISNISRRGFYIGEIAIVVLLTGFSFLFGKGDSLMNNTQLVYPLYEVSTLECRTLHFDELPENCKIKLPIIHGADFATYQNNKTYTDIYTTHWGASYTSWWDNMVGTHYGTDIATAPGTPLYAIADGVVYSSVYNSAYGNVVKIKFQYQGEILYAVYAHMSERLVEAGDIVQAGDIIGKTGNSGNVFWALGGYHVHFEIDKDNNGRPSWVFSTCPTISKGDYAVIQAGECRMQLFQYTKDPIVLLENAHAKYPINLNTKNDTEENWEKEQKEEQTHGTPITWEVQSWVTLSGENQNIEPFSGENTDTETINSWSINSWINNEIIEGIKENSKEESIETGNIITENKNESQETQKEETTNTIELDFSELDYYGKTFIEENEITIQKNFSDSISLNEENAYFTISLKDKRKNEVFNGTSSIPFVFISNNTNIHFSPVSTILFSQWSAVVQIKPQKKGSSYIVIMLGTKKIAGITLHIE